MSIHNHLAREIRPAVARNVGIDPSESAAKAAKLILEAGIGFSNQYTLLDGTTGLGWADDENELPLVGLNLALFADVEALAAGGQSLCPEGAEEILVADWYAGDRYTFAASEDDVALAGIAYGVDAQGARTVVGETLFHTTPDNVFAATKLAIVSGLVPAKFLNQ